ncbi:MAG: hypothetical protein EXS39_06820 [Opitutaceae bacterium]|nr:hypothetical protein [Opitutaceae bacterium]
MKFFQPTSRLCAVFVVLGGFVALAAAPGRAAPDDPRFSALLRPEQWIETGLAQFTADNVAVIDALVRVDQAARDFRNNIIGSTHFSQRRTAHERSIAGLDRLTPTQLEKLDNILAQHLARPQVPFDAALPCPRLIVEPLLTPSRPPEIHGEFSLTYGWGKGGSVRGGEAVFTYDDPAHRFSLLFGYSEYHGNGYVPFYYPADSFIRNRPVADAILPNR